MIAKVFPEVFQKLTFVFSAKENLNTFQNTYLPHSPFPGPAFIRKGLLCPLEQDVTTSRSFLPDLQMSVLQNLDIVSPSMPLSSQGAFKIVVLS